jgi:hypothetical protein
MSAAAARWSAVSPTYNSVRDFVHETLVGNARPRNLGRRLHQSHRLGVVGDDSNQELDCLREDDGGGARPGV